MYAHTNLCMNTWTHTSLLWNGGMKVRVFHVSLSQLWHEAVLLSVLNSLSELIPGQNGAPWYGGPAKKTLHKSVTHSCTGRSSDWMMNSSGEGPRQNKFWDNATMQVKKTSSNPEALWGSRVGCYNGDRWSYGLTYFSFWEGLLWPASALNCALFSESKGKPKMKQIERDSRKSEKGRDRDKQTKVHYIQTLKCESDERLWGFWNFKHLDQWFCS